MGTDDFILREAKVNTLIVSSEPSSVKEMFERLYCISFSPLTGIYTYLKISSASKFLSFKKLTGHHIKMEEIHLSFPV